MAAEDPRIHCLRNCSQICLWTTAWALFWLPRQVRVVPDFRRYRSRFFYFVSISCGIRSMFPCDKSLSGRSPDRHWLHPFPNPKLSISEKVADFCRERSDNTERISDSAGHSHCDSLRFCFWNIKVATDSHQQLVKPVCLDNAPCFNGQ